MKVVLIQLHHSQEQGVVVFGQKTLQGKPSALDRINVRRLLIDFVNSLQVLQGTWYSNKNTAATRNRFLYCESIFEFVQAKIVVWKCISK